MHHVTKSGRRDGGWAVPAHHHDAAPAYRFTLSALVTALLLTLLPQLPHVVPEWLSGMRATARTVWPQGWGFFATAAHDRSLVTYVLRGDPPTPMLTTQPLRSADNRWGVGKAGEARQFEARELALRIPDDAWQRCPTRSGSTCADWSTAVPSLRLVNHAVRPEQCGSVVFALEPPHNAADATALAALVDVACGQ